MIESPGIIRATLGSLAKLLSVKDDQIEDALSSEKLVRRTLNRRGLLLGGMAAAAAVALPTGLVTATGPAEQLIATRMTFKVEISDFRSLTSGIAGYAAYKWTQVDGSQIQLSERL